MKIVRDKKVERNYLGKIQKSYENKERTGLHVSDVLDPRLWYWKNKKPLPLTDAQIGYFLSGEILHVGVQTKLGIVKEKKVLFGNVKGSIDLPSIEGHPGELKSSRKWTIPEVPEETYIDQLIYYCAADGSSTGYIWVFYFTPGRNWKHNKSTDPTFIMWRCEFTDKEIEQAKKRLTVLPKKMLKAEREGDHTILPLCHKWKCCADSKWGTEVRCPYWEDCKPKGRYGKNGKIIRGCD
jgi:hypothetical protein